MCYAVMAHVTDYDVWHETEEVVTVETVVKNLLANTQVAKQAIEGLARTLPDDIDCKCHHALRDAILTDKEAVPQSVKEDLGLLVGKYFEA